MKNIYQTLLKTVVVTFVSLFALAPAFTFAQQMSDVAPVDTVEENMCINLPASFGYRATDRSTSGSVSLLQDFLISKGYLNSESTGYFGSMTVNAVKKYQTSKGFGATGYVGNYTRAAIKTDTCGNTAQPVPKDPAVSTNSTTSTSNTTTSTTAIGTSGTAPTKVIIRDAAGKPSYNSYFKCGDKSNQSNIIQYSPNSNGEVTFSPSDCRKKGTSMWISCPVGQVSSLASEVLAEFKDQTVVTCATADYIKKTAAVVAASVASAATCPDGTARQLVVVGPSTGCEGHETPVGTAAPKGTTGSATTCPDGSARPLVVIGGGGTGCENHEFKFSLMTSNTLSGNFVQNGNLYNSMPIYNRLTGVSKSNPPKLCIQLQGNTNCLTASGYRDALPGEWLTDTVIQTIVQDPSIYPASTYTTYVMYPNGSPIRTGSFALIAGSPTAKAVPTLSVSNSLNGPYAVNGTVYNNSPVYSQTTGVQKSGAPKGCMQIKYDSACNLASSYRVFTSAEWVSDNTIQTVVGNPSAYPVSKYEGFIMYSDGKFIKTGEFYLTTPPVAAPTPVVEYTPTCAGPGACGGVREVGGYGWRAMTNLMGIISSTSLDSFGLTAPAYECNASTVNKTEKAGTYTIICEVWYK